MKSIKKIVISLLVVTVLSPYLSTVFAVSTEILNNDIANIVEQNEILVNEVNSTEEEFTVVDEDLEENEISNVKNNVIENETEKGNVIVENTIDEKEKEFNVIENKTDLTVTGEVNYIGKMVIDEPGLNQTFISPNKDGSKKILKVRGWAISEDSNAKIEVLIDGILSQEQVVRTKRVDVNNSSVKGYETSIANTPNAGFETYIDISNLSDKKVHTITVNQRNGIDNNLISSENLEFRIQRPSYKGKMVIDEPTPRQVFIHSKFDGTKTFVKVRGWAISEDSNATLKLEIDGIDYSKVFKKTSRPDVNNNSVKGYEEAIKNTPNAGFETTVDITNLTEGIHKITVIEQSRFGNDITSQTMEIDVRRPTYTGKIVIDEPSMNQNVVLPNKNGEDILKVRGWAISDDVNGKLEILIDGKICTEEIIRTSRPDVNNNSVKNFVDAINNTPKAGFESYIDLSNLENKMHVITVLEKDRYGKVIASSNTEINLKKGKLVIDEPIPNQVFTVPSKDGKSVILKIRGWAISADENAKIEIEIDGKLCSEEVIRTQRLDVNNKSVKGFEEAINNTKNAGYESYIDISNFDAKQHTIKVTQRSSKGKVIISEERKINVEKPKFTGRMVIDEPTLNQSFTAPNKDGLGKLIKVRGWAISDDSLATIEIKIDGNLCSEPITRTQRLDVNNTSIKNFEEAIKNTEKSGYESFIDISDLSEDKHTITVIQKDRFGTEIVKTNMQIDVKKPRYNGTMRIDEPSVKQSFTAPNKDGSGVITKLRGWAIAEDDKATLEVYLNGNKIETQIIRTSRPDVNNSSIKGYEEAIKNTENSGYETFIDISDLNEGINKITVIQRSKYGHEISSKTIEINIERPRYLGKLNVDEPINGNIIKIENGVSQKVKVRGWAISEDEQAKVNVYFDNTLIKAVTRYSRPDVNIGSVQEKETDFTDAVNNTADSGFVTELIVDKNTLPGTHIIKVEQISRYGHNDEKREVREIRIKVDNPSYTFEGVQCMDYPIQDKNFYFGSSILVQGWALSSDEEAIIEVYLNGNLVATNIERYEREKVVHDLFDKWGKTKKAGYKCTIPTENYISGDYIVEVKQKDRYGRVISHQERRIYIKSRDYYVGADVSHHNNDIDWVKLKNESGIQFAIIRVGYYLTSQRRFVLDTKFEQNYNACKAAGIPVGGYIYSYAFNASEGAEEAEKLLAQIAGKNFELPLYIDMEDKLQMNNSNREDLTNAVIAFCDRVRASGYKAGVYANKYFYENYLYKDRLSNYDIWVAHYTEGDRVFTSTETVPNPTDFIGKLDMWQYTSSGSLTGNGSAWIDLNILFKKYF